MVPILTAALADNLSLLEILSLPSVALYLSIVSLVVMLAFSAVLLAVLRHLMAQAARAEAARARREEQFSQILDRAIDVLASAVLRLDLIQRE